MGISHRSIRPRKYESVLARLRDFLANSSPRKWSSANCTANAHDLPVDVLSALPLSYEAIPQTTSSPSLPLRNSPGSDLLKGPACTSQGRFRSGHSITELLPCGYAPHTKIVDESCDRNDMRCAARASCVRGLAVTLRLRRNVRALASPRNRTSSRVGQHKRISCNRTRSAANRHYHS